ncbi:hypothetical protein [Mycobacterium paraseoulense]|uniref:Uncharacterized protein n=1 Tax=Mycobacterium paraseoulense TaxID=590652 RepID=A0A1X0I725_9MYCO|nr:hypothetical protein [Mycobacterium paraseoulense]MCV7395958.1 hypothetical protein [Mycobacterium paraseoulense]ORB37457.1 hypothetical protein BST39_19020 [Mycobacterium paraseoulense]BBZ72357.1 hypothetical protein MPRS_34500 [Mycobacterium paraseoulense]
MGDRSAATTTALVKALGEVDPIIIVGHHLTLDQAPHGDEILKTKTTAARKSSSIRADRKSVERELP